MNIINNNIKLQSKEPLLSSFHATLEISIVSQLFCNIAATESLQM